MTMTRVEQLGKRRIVEQAAVPVASVADPFWRIARRQAAAGDDMVNCDRLSWVAVVERLDFPALDVRRGDNEFDFGSRDPPNIDVLGESSLYGAQIVKARPQWQIVIVLPW